MMSHALDPLPLSHLLGPLPLERDVLYGRPLRVVEMNLHKVVKPSLTIALLMYWPLEQSNACV